MVYLSGAAALALQFAPLFFSQSEYFQIVQTYFALIVYNGVALWLLDNVISQNNMTGNGNTDVNKTSHMLHKHLKHSPFYEVTAFSASL